MSGVKRLKKHVLDKLRKIVGSENLLEDRAGLVCYSADFYPGLTHIPELVVKPQTVKQVIGIVGLAYRHGFSLIPRGAGTSVTGGSIPADGGVVVDLSGMNRILEVDLDNRQTTVETGVVWGELNRALAKHGFFFPSTPGSASVSTVGGSIATGGSGMRSAKYGTVRANILGLEVVLPKGELTVFGSKAFKSSCGYDLKDLFIGSEGTLGIAVKATMRIYPLPETKVLVSAKFREPETMNMVVCKLLRLCVPSALEFADNVALSHLDGEEDSGVELLVELDGASRAVESDLEKVLKVLSDGCLTLKVAADPEQQSKLWEKHSQLYFKLVQVKPTPIAEDLAVPVSRIASMLGEIHRIAEKYSVEVAALGHASDGTIHAVILADVSEKQVQKKVLKVRREMYSSALKLGGTITAEHGLGLYRSSFAALELGSKIQIMRDIKRILNPKNIMNPDKMSL